MRIDRDGGRGTPSVVLTRILLLATVLGVAVAGCRPDDRRDGKGASEVPEPPPSAFGAGLEELKFDVDPVLLGFTYEDSTLGIRFAPPRGWPPVDEAMVNEARDRIERAVPGEDHLVSRPVRIFIDQDSRLYMILAEFPRWRAPLDPFQALAEYRLRVAAAMPDAEIAQGFFRHGPLAVYQLIITNQVAVNVRVFFLQEGRPPVQIDYLSPRSMYPKIVKAVEASIGSVQPLSLPATPSSGGSEEGSFD